MPNVKNPKLNNVNAFQLILENSVPNKLLSSGEIKLFIENELGSFFSSETSVSKTIAHFSGTYTYTKSLIEAVSYIAEKWCSQDSPLNDSTKKQIVCKIVERAEHCSPGFHNGLLEIIKFLNQGDTVQSYLQLIREDIVNQASIELGAFDDHKHQTVHFSARVHDYGVRANAKDIYLGNHNDIKIVTKLEQVFNRHYQPLQIISRLLGLIESTLRAMYEYAGYLHDDYYLFNTYREWEKFINVFFKQDNSNEQFTIQRILDFDDKFIVRDINWLFIKELLIKHLCEKYINFRGSQYKDLASLLTSTDEKTSLEHAMKLLKSALFVSVEEMDALFHLIDHLSKVSQKSIYWVFLDSLEDNQVTYMIKNFEKLTYLKKQSTDEILSARLAAVSNIDLCKNFKNQPKCICPFITCRPNLINQYLKSCSNKLGDLATIWHLMQEPDRVQYLKPSIQANIPQDLVGFIYKNRSQHQIFSMLIQCEGAEKITNTLIRQSGSTVKAFGFAVRFFPAAVEPILKATPDKYMLTLLMNTLKDGEHDGINALMLALKYSPQVVELLLTAIPKTGYLKLLRQEVKLGNERGMNALMFAVKYCPAVFSLMLKRIPAEDVTDFVSQTISQGPNRGSNALRLAILHHPELVKNLLAPFSKEKVIELFFQTDPEGFTPLALAAINNKPGAIRAIIEITPREKRASLILTKNLSGSTTFLIATQSCPQIINYLFEAVAEEEKIALVSQRNEYGLSPLFKAVCFQGDCIESIIKVMSKNALREELKWIYSGQDLHGKNILMIAGRRNPANLKKLLQLTPKKLIAEVMFAGSKNGWTVLMDAICYYPSLVVPMFNCMPEDHRLALLLKTTPSSVPTVVLVAQYCPKNFIKIINKMSTVELTKLISQANNHQLSQRMNLYFSSNQVQKTVNIFIDKQCPVQQILNTLCCMSNDQLNRCLSSDKSRVKLLLYLTDYLSTSSKIRSYFWSRSYYKYLSNLMGEDLSCEQLSARITKRKYSAQLNDPLFEKILKTSHEINLQQPLNVRQPPVSHRNNPCERSRV